MIDSIVLGYVKAIEDAESEIEIVEKIRLILTHVHKDHYHIYQLLTHLECLMDEAREENK